jgi:orotidine-5'-phosphate decarboxylase
MNLEERLPDRSLIPACDVDLERFEYVIEQSCDLQEVGAYKIGTALALSVGIGTVVRSARRHTDKPLIYDHQKAGTDIPDTAEGFMSTLADAGIDAVILFPLAGPATQIAWTRAAVATGLSVLVGGHMTHPDFLSEDGGYMPGSSVENMYRLAAGSGVINFVVPGNDPEALARIRSIVSEAANEPILYAAGFVSQGGWLSAAGRAAGSRWHAFVGRAIHEKNDVRQAIKRLAHDLNSELPEMER